MIPLAIWLAIFGYTMAWTGRQNMGLNYQPQSDGTIKAVDSAGNLAQSWTLFDAFTCSGPSGKLGSASGPKAPVAPSTGTPPPGAQGNPIGNPTPQPAPIQTNPIFNPPPDRNPFPLPPWIVLPPLNLPGLHDRVTANSSALDGVSRWVHDTVNSIVGGFHLPSFNAPRPTPFL